MLLASLVIYGALHGSWGWFAVLFLAPDLAMFGYLAGPKVGAVCYNAMHTYAVPLGLGMICQVTGHAGVWPWLAIWMAHIGFDRMVGYGLKYPTAFKATHLGRV